MITHCKKNSLFTFKFCTKYFHSNLNKLRSLMKLNNYDAYVLTNSDPHKNEYLLEKDKKIKYISNFTGSNALALVTSEKAVLWTDSRYHLQAEKELNEEWQMIPMEDQNSDLKHFMCRLKEGSKIALEYKNLSVNFLLGLKDYFKSKNVYLELVDDKQNLGNEVISRKKIQTQNETNVFIHDMKYSGVCSTEKYKTVKENLINKFRSDNASGKNNTNITDSELNQTNFAIVINKLDEIAWLTNLRGCDIPHNPVFFSYAILHLFHNNEAKLDLYTNDSKFKNIQTDYLKQNNLEIKDYNNFYIELESLKTMNTTVVLDKNSSNYSIYEKIISSGSKHLLLDYNPIEYSKSIKNPTELEGFRNSHKRDGAAIVRYLAWLENELLDKNNKVTEYEGALKLLQFRRENELFIEESFDTISSSGENSAIIHYKPDSQNSKLINPNEIYLLDSGGHYLDGTTDTTRVVHFGGPLQIEKEMYTRVLLGNLSVERILLNKNKNLSGSLIDSLARQYLWQVGEDYGHGTGHGVGHFLNVHEGPQSISARSTVPLVPGMVTSNEPGFYLKGQFGIRIENILLTLQNKGEKDCLFFENVTKVNYESNLIEKSLLNKEIIDYINEYHHQVFVGLENILRDKDDTLAINYIKRKTQYL